MALDGDGPEWSPTPVTLVRVLAILGTLAVLRGALAPWSFNVVGFEEPGFRVGMVLAVVGAVAVVAGPRHPLGAVLAVVGGVRATYPASQRVLWSLGGEMWFAGFVWTGAGALLLVAAGITSGNPIPKRRLRGDDGTAVEDSVKTETK